MSAENAKRALKIISERNQEAKMLAAQRYNQILDEIPRMREIYAQLAQTGMKIANIVFTNDTDFKDVGASIEGIKNQNLRLQRELRLLLERSGYSGDYLDTHYTCAKCEDTGFVEGRRCQCMKRLVVELDVEAFNGSLNMSPVSFDSFSLKYYSDTLDGRGISPQKTMASILEFCMQYSEKFHRNAPSVLMIGDTGLGKTHLSLCMANVIIKHGYHAIYASSLDLFRVLQNEYFGRGEPEKNTIQTIIDADLVIIDDLGAEFDSAFNCSSLYNIVNSRLNANKPTIINTNLTPTELEKRYSQRVTSRLMTLYKCLKFSGKDVRLQRLKNNEL